MSILHIENNNFSVSIKKIYLNFNFPAKTSRGAISQKETYLIKLTNLHSGVYGIGECSPLKGLSPEFDVNYEEKLISYTKAFMKLPNEDGLYNLPNIKAYPSILFGLEMVLKDLELGGEKLFFETAFAKSEKSIPINGLVWMGDRDFMLQQMNEKLEKGFTCIKIKIGGIAFEDECNLLKTLRKQFSPEIITIRLDANGAFPPDEALQKLEILSQFSIHSIEQPIKPGQRMHMYHICKESPIPIALDEELIGICDVADKQKLLEATLPQYIILKPSLLGGFKASEEWINLAENNNINWWITSALESNIGLNAIAQFASVYNNPIPQGLGTGQLYSNNIASPLQIKEGELCLGDKDLWDEIFF